MSDILMYDPSTKQNFFFLDKTRKTAADLNTEFYFTFKGKALKLLVSRDFKKNKQSVVIFWSGIDFQLIFKLTEAYRRLPSPGFHQNKQKLFI